MVWSLTYSQTTWNAKSSGPYKASTQTKLDGIPVKLFQILKDDAVEVLHSICQQIWKTQQWPQNWKRLVFIPVPKKGNAKECSHHHTTVLISHARKGMLKSSPSQTSTVHEPWTSRCSSWMYKRQKNERSNCQHPLDHRKSKRVPEKHLLLLYWLCQSLWLVWITIKCGKLLEIGIPDYLYLPPEKSVCRSRSNS